VTGIDLSVTELDVVWRAKSFGALPLIIDVPSPGASHAERGAIERQVWAELVARGLADDHGHPHWRLADRLETIARRSRSLQLRVFGADATRAILAVRGRSHVLGVLGDRFHLKSVPRTGIAATLLALLPEVPAGQGYSVNVDTAVFSAAATATAAHDTLVKHGLDPDDARTMLSMATGSVRTIQLVGERRDADGRTTRSRPVSVHDTPAGRYRTIRTITDTADHLTVTPTTTAALANALDQLTPAPP
jgi:hypothetical protein